MSQNYSRLASIIRESLCVCMCMCVRVYVCVCRGGQGVIFQGRAYYSSRCIDRICLGRKPGVAEGAQDLGELTNL